MGRPMGGGGGSGPPNNFDSTFNLDSGHALQAAPRFNVFIRFDQA